MQFDFHRLAAKEYLKARRWYARRSMRASSRFIEAVSAAIEAILADPHRWPKEDNEVRSVLLKKFPYILYFAIENEESILVLAVAHTSRRPGYWKRRVKRH